MSYLFFGAGVVGVLLGGLWLLQGLGIVHVEPFLCVAECAPIEEPSPTWAIVGFLTVCAGILALALGLGRAKGFFRD